MWGVIFENKCSAWQKSRFKIWKALKSKISKSLKSNVNYRITIVKFVMELQFTFNCNGRGWETNSGQCLVEGVYCYSNAFTMTSFGKGIETACASCFEEHGSPS